MTREKPFDNGNKKKIEAIDYCKKYFILKKHFNFLSYYQRIMKRYYS